VAAAVNPLIAGHMRKKPYGDHIDNHDVVVRFNLVPLERKHVGMRTHVRLLNFANSKKVCDKGQKELMAGEKSLGDLRSVMLWHKLSRGAVTDCIKRTALAGGEVRAGEIGPATQRKLRDAMQKVKKDLTALRVSSMKPQFAQELTSGAQAVLLALGGMFDTRLLKANAFDVEPKVDYTHLYQQCTQGVKCDGTPGARGVAPPSSRFLVHHHILVQTSHVGGMSRIAPSTLRPLQRSQRVRPEQLRRGQLQGHQRVPLPGAGPPEGHGGAVHIEFS
jgi:hypothetical protein